MKCEPSLYPGRIGRLPAVARALRATLTVQPGHASAEKAAKEDSKETDPLVGLYVSAVSLEDYRACMEQVQASSRTCRARMGVGEVTAGSNGIQGNARQ